MLKQILTLGLLSRPGKPSVPHYYCYKKGIIADIHPSSGNINDCGPFVERLKVIQDKFELDIKSVGADRGYDTTINHGLKTLEITGYISPINYDTAFDTTSYRDFIYNNQTDTYTCPNQKELTFTHLVSKGENYYKTYSVKPKTVKSVLLEKIVLGKRQVGEPFLDQ